MPNRLAKWWQQWRWCWEQIIVVLLSFHERDSKIAYRGGEICVRGWRTPAGILIVSHGQDEFRELEALRAGERLELPAIDQRDGSSFSHKNISRVRIPVDESCPKNHATECRG